MIAPRFPVIRAVMVKDMRLFWPFTAAIVLLSLLAWGLQLTGLFDMGSAKSLWALGELAAGFLMIALVQQDPPSSDTHDWLIRPIGKLELLTAKALFIVLFTLLPLAIGYAVITLTGGESLSAVLQALGGATISAIVTVPVVMAFASLTRNIGLAIAAAIALLVVYIVLSVTSLQNVAQGEAVRWLVSKPAGVIMLPLSLVVMWLAYDRREMVKSRALFAGGVTLLLALISYMPASALFAAEQAVAGNGSAAEPVRLAMAPGCFSDASGLKGLPPSMSMTDKDGKRNPAAEKFVLDLAGAFAGVAWTPRELDDAGRSPLAFTTHVDPSGVPAGDVLTVDHVWGRFVDAAGATVAKPFIARRVKQDFRHDGANDFDESWLIGRTQAQSLAGARFQLDYDLTVMKPVGRYSLMADGHAHDLPGLGSCRVHWTKDQAHEHVMTCKLTASAPAMILSQVPGHAGKQGHADYTPAWLKAGERSYVLDVAPDDADVAYSPPPAGGVSLITYQAVSHIHRGVLAPPGALGGPATACPF